jgi:hypothetical protein
VHWQDSILTVGQFFFIAALIPALKHKHKPPFVTSFMNASVLFIFAGVYVTLSLWFASITTAIVGVMWLVLAIQNKKLAK